jgi:hypothetical protein
MSSIAVATLGMFQDCQYRHQGSVGGTLMRVDEVKPKPIVRLLKITSKDEGEKKKKIEVTVINTGD